MLDQRKKIILETVIKEHIKTGQPVGSEILVEKYKLNISPATVRNEMVELEKEGFIRQPYTSAGRVPTEEAYQLYLEDLSYKKLSKTEINLLESILKNKEESNLKQMAKALAKISDNAVFLAINKNNLYYTGISNLLHQPEFTQSNLIYDISEIIDQLDEIINKIFDEIEPGIQVFIGSKNPFGDFCSTILAKYRLHSQTGLIGILGPLRMDYEKNLALLNFINNKLVK